jgi:hypothetical protein
MTETPAPQRILTAEEVYGPDWDDEAVEAVLDESLSPRSLMDLAPMSSCSPTASGASIR